jgi:glutamate N-acetyltransferase/amino-acid N-acetyltransferase
MKSSEGGLLVKGVRLGATRAPIYENRDRDDLVLMGFDEGTVGAAVTTTNRLCAAPVHVLRANLATTASVRFWLLNAGNANAGTGKSGMDSCLQTVRAVAKLAGVDTEMVWPFSTGVIGEPLPVQSICDALPRAMSVFEGSSVAWDRVSRAIMTTDTRPKLRHIQCHIGGQTVSLTGVAKGSGMIHPNMATMFGLIASDVVMEADCLQVLLTRAVNHSFNCVTVDGDTSTNDVCAIVATQQAGHAVIDNPDSQDAQIFALALSALSDDLAEMLARDGEGATKFVSVVCETATNDADAHTIANTVALSPLVKTALAASDPNWGRIVAAVGRAPVPQLEIEQVDIWINSVQIVQKGSRHSEYTEEAGRTAMESVDIVIRISMGVGSGYCRVMTCDLTNEYVRINAEYRT